MRMLTRMSTRVAGYPFSFTFWDDNRVVGMFHAETENNERTTFMDLPYELRSTYESTSGQTIGILTAAVAAVRELQGKVDSTWSIHALTTDSPCGCEHCEIAAAMYSRECMAGRAPITY